MNYKEWWKEIQKGHCMAEWCSKGLFKPGFTKKVRYLFKKNNGEFFEAAHGSYFRCFALKNESTTHGFCIKYLTQEQAKNWVKKYASDDYDQIF